MDKLTDVKIRSLTTPGKYADGVIGGLYIEVAKTGSRLWRLKYRLHGKENRFSIGAYPDITIKKAREIAQGARELIASGIAPLAAKEAENAARAAAIARTFQSVADDFMQHKGLKAPKRLPGHLARNTLQNYCGALTNHIIPTLGKLPVQDITREHIKAMVRALSESPAMAAYVVRLTKSILDRAVDDGYLTANVAAGRGILPKHKATSYAAITKPADLRELLLLLDGYRGQDAVMSALRLLTMIPARPSEMASMRWTDLDLDAGEWSYTISKTGSPHIAALPSQAVALLRELQERRIPSKGEGWVFPSPKNVANPIATRALLAGLVDRLGYAPGSITTHGFRSTFRTIAHEVLNIDFVVLELMLSHRMPGPLSAIYARAQLLSQRKAAAQEWADYLDSLRTKADER